MSDSIKHLSTEAFLAQQVEEWENAGWDEKDFVARNFLCGLVLYIERAEKMIPIMARAHLKSLYAKWRQFCVLTEVETSEGDCERYDEALFGSAIVILNDDKGKAFVTLHKMIWSRASMEQFNHWVNTFDDHYSEHFAPWVR